MRSFENNQNEQDFRIMAVEAVLVKDKVYIIFGTSSGEIEFHLLAERKLE